MSATHTAPVSARECARQLGIGVDTLLRRYRAGCFKAEIDSGRVKRFDVAKVKKALSQPRPRRAHLPDGMVPTIPL